MGTTRCVVLLLLLFRLLPACGAEDAPAAAPFVVRPLAEPRRAATRYEAFAVIADTFHIDGTKEAEPRKAEPFRDVPPGHWAAREIDAMRRAVFCQGCGDGTFRGQLPLTRGGLAEVLTLVVHWLVANVPRPSRPAPASASPATSAPKWFRDLPTDHWMTADYGFLQGNGILRGYGDGTVRRKRPVTRCELQLCLERIAQAWDPDPRPHFTVRALPEPRQTVVRYELYALMADVFAIEGRTLLGPPNAVGKPFTDVPDWHWAAMSIDAMRKAGLCEGYGDGTFRGSTIVTRYALAWAASDMLAGLIRVLGKPLRRPVAAGDPFADVPTDMWGGPAPKVEFLRQWGIVQGYPDGTFRGKRPLRRGELQVCLERMAALWEPAGAMDPPKVALCLSMFWKGACPEHGRSQRTR